MNNEDKAQKSGDSIANPEPPEGTEKPSSEPPESAREIGGRKGPDPTRYGDWEKGGRCIDF